MDTIVIGTSASARWLRKALYINVYFSFMDMVHFLALAGKSVGSLDKNGKLLIRINYLVSSLLL